MGGGTFMLKCLYSYENITMKKVKRKAVFCEFDNENTKLTHWGDSSTCCSQQLSKVSGRYVFNSPWQGLNTQIFSFIVFLHVMKTFAWNGSKNKKWTFLAESCSRASNRPDTDTDMFGINWKCFATYAPLKSLVGY